MASQSGSNSYSFQSYSREASKDSLSGLKSFIQAHSAISLIAVVGTVPNIVPYLTLVVWGSFHTKRLILPLNDAAHALCCRGVGREEGF
jgi:hypothetical protein